MTQANIRELHENITRMFWEVTIQKAKLGISTPAAIEIQLQDLTVLRDQLSLVIAHYDADVDVPDNIRDTTIRAAKRSGYTLKREDF